MTSRHNVKQLSKYNMMNDIFRKSLSTTFSPKNIIQIGTDNKPAFLTLNNLAEKIQAYASCREEYLSHKYPPASGGTSHIFDRALARKLLLMFPYTRRSFFPQ